MHHFRKRRGGFPVDPGNLSINLSLKHKSATERKRKKKEGTLNEWLKMKGGKDNKQTNRDTFMSPIPHTSFFLHRLLSFFLHHLLLSHLSSYTIFFYPIFSPLKIQTKFYSHPLPCLYARVVQREKIEREKNLKQGKNLKERQRREKDGSCPSQSLMLSKKRKKHTFHFVLNKEICFHSYDEWSIN